MLFTLALLWLVLPGSVLGLCCRMAFGPASSSDAWSSLPQTDMETGFSRPNSIYYPWDTYDLFYISVSISTTQTTVSLSLTQKS